MSEKIIWAVGDKVRVQGEKDLGTVTEIVPMMWGFNMYKVSVNGREVQMVADAPPIKEDKPKKVLTDPPKPKLEAGERVVVKSLKGKKSNEATIVQVGAAVPDGDGKWIVEYQVELVHNGERVIYREDELASFRDCQLS